MGSGARYTLEAVSRLTLGQGLGEPDDIVVAPDGAALYSDLTSGTVVRLGPTGVRTAIASGLQSPEGLAITGPNSLLIAEQGTNRVLEWRLNEGLHLLAQLPVRLGVDGIDGLSVGTFQGATVALLPDSASGRLLWMALGGGQPTVAAQHWQRPTDAVLWHNQVFLVDEYGGGLWHGPLGGTLQRLGPQMNLPDDVVITNDGVAIVNELSGVILAIDSTGASRVLASGLADPQGIALDGADNLLIAESGARGVVSELLRTCLPVVPTFPALTLHVGEAPILLPAGSACTPDQPPPSYALAIGSTWPSGGNSIEQQAESDALLLPNGTRARLLPSQVAGAPLLQVEAPAVAASVATSILEMRMHTGFGNVPVQVLVTIKP